MKINHVSGKNKILIVKVAIYSVRNSPCYLIESYQLTKCAFEKVNLQMENEIINEGDNQKN